MNPFFFGASERALFGAYHPPQTEPARTTGVVICNPFGDEAIKAHRAFVQLAKMLSAERFHVLRFDYSCTGDSMGEGEDASVEQWLEDIGDAATELKDIAGVNKVSFAGLRLGATLALTAASGRRDVAKVVLWDPVVEGQAYLDDLQRHHEVYLGAEFGEHGPSRETSGMTDDEIMGFAMKAPLRTKIAALNLATLKVKRLKHVVVIASTKAGAGEHLCRNLEAQQLKVNHQYVPVGVNWNADEAMESALVPTEALQAIVAAVT